jgi:cysteine desulfurase family protein (TIGR01976 family)
LVDGGMRVLDLTTIRARFPGLAREAIFLDNPAGTQMVQSSLDRMNEYAVKTNANHGGVFATSRESDAVIDTARQAVADFLGAARPEEIVFGPNMTTLTLHISRSIARRLDAGDTIVVTRLDHDANITPWTLIAEDRGCTIEWVDFDVEDGSLKLDTLEQALEKKPKLVAVGYASNALGTINPVKKITEMAHAVGAWVYVDAVQYAPHGPIDVGDLDVEFLACSAYKFYGPHVGMLYGKYDLLDDMEAYKVRPASSLPPGKFETGTQNFEGIAGVWGALEHYQWLGETFGSVYEERYAERYSGQALRLKQGMAVMRSYEYELSRALLERFAEVPGLRVYGNADPRKVEQRVPTMAINIEGIHPRRLAELLDEHGIYVWDGNYYALAVTERLGVEDSGGMVRVGAAHYNTLEEIDRLAEVLKVVSS